MVAMTDIDEKTTHMTYDMLISLSDPKTINLSLRYRQYTRKNIDAS